jgi:hypothetical protein
MNEKFKKKIEKKQIRKKNRLEKKKILNWLVVHGNAE